MKRPNKRLLTQSAPAATFKMPWKSETSENADMIWSSNPPLKNRIGKPCHAHKLWLYVDMWIGDDTYSKSYV